MDYKRELAFAKELATEAGVIMKRYFRAKDNGEQTKDDKTLLTIADVKINSMVISRVQKEFSGHSVHGEEERLHIDNAAYTWVCDPIDGTMPFVKGLPISTFSLALVDKNGIAVLGVVYDPYGDRLFEAVRGSGAFVNGEKLQVSGKYDLGLAYIDLEMWVNEHEGVSFDDPRGPFSKRGVSVTALSSAVITGCLVAEGKYDAMIFGQSKPEDIAALSVIVEEAGGRVTDLRGRSQRYDRQIYGAIVSNGALHDALVGVLKLSNYKSKYFVES